MQIEFYNTSSEINRVGKTLENKTVLVGNFKGEVDLRNPVMTVSTNLLNFNYCYIPDINRYYFIEKIEITRSNLFTITLHIDVLETYKTAIKKLNVIVSQSNNNPYYNGFVKGVDVRTEYETKMFTNNFDENGQIILLALYGAERT